MPWKKTYGTIGQKCVRFGKVKKKVCVKWSGGKKKQGRPGKSCVKKKVRTVRQCRDFA